MGTASEALAAFVSSLTYDDLPAEVTTAAKRHLLDAAGVALAAAHAGTKTPAVDMTRSWAGARESTIVGYDFGAPAPWAAFVNSALVHALDFDDTHMASVVHPSSVVVPAALAVAEEVGASGRDLIVAAVAGYEVIARVGGAAPGRFHARGLHTTGICGTFAAAAVAGSLWGLSSEELTHAFGIAGSTSAGLLASMADGSEAMRLSPGWAAHAGIITADLARRGATGPATVFEGPHGVFEALLAGEEVDRARLVSELGSTWETTRIAIKPYPASHFVLAFMDAAARAQVKWADVEEVVCGVAPPVINLICEPRAMRLHPATAQQAQSSLPFAVASTIVGGRSALELFGDDARADRRVLQLAERVRHEPDPSLRFPDTYGGRLTVYTRGGRAIEVDEGVNRGHPDRPLDDEELTEKFLRNAKPRLEMRGAKRLLAVIGTLEDHDAEDLAKLLKIS